MRSLLIGNQNKPFHYVFSIKIFLMMHKMDLNVISISCALKTLYSKCMRHNVLIEQVDVCEFFKIIIAGKLSGNDGILKKNNKQTDFNVQCCIPYLQHVIRLSFSIR